MTGLYPVAFPIAQSSLYHAYMEERGHIIKNKWYLSERYGYEVTYEFAKWDWQVNHRPQWMSGILSGIKN